MTKSNLEYLISKSGELEVEEVGYDGVVLTLRLFFSELDLAYDFKVITSNLYCGKFVDDYGALKKCYLDIDDLKSLTVENNIYVPNANFGVFMKEERNKLSLAYGQKKDNVFVFSVKSSSVVISCLISNLKDITIYERKDQ